ncbi:MAG TPA: NADH-quinone oxidoreductase subunit C [Candidatus Eisenbacteria bacterium]
MNPEPADLDPPSAEQAKITAKLRARLGDACRGDRVFRGQLSLYISPPSLLDALRFLKTDPELLFDMLTDVTSVDRLPFLEPGEPRFEVVYNLYSLTFNRRVLVKVPLADGAAIASATALWGTANFLEREVYDLMGIVFSGHPNLERILTPEGWLGHPLRKDFPTQSDQFPNVES